MKHRSSINKRLGRLEVAAHKGASAYRVALIVLNCDTLPEESDLEMTGLNESHLVMTGSHGGECYFESVPGPGPQIGDFGEFDSVTTFLPWEWEA
jgi:hypothetical protein